MEHRLIKSKLSLTSSDTWNSVLCIVASECLPKWKGWTSCATLSPSSVPIQATGKYARISFFFSRHTLQLD